MDPEAEANATEGFQPWRSRAVAGVLGTNPPGTRGETRERRATGSVAHVGAGARCKTSTHRPEVCHGRQILLRDVKANGRWALDKKGCIFLCTAPDHATMAECSTSNDR